MISGLQAWRPRRALIASPYAFGREVAAHRQHVVAADHGIVRVASPRPLSVSIMPTFAMSGEALGEQQRALRLAAADSA
jgi:hypothetical protein